MQTYKVHHELKAYTTKHKMIETTTITTLNKSAKDARASPFRLAN
jgi:hypothetical protein